MLALGLCIALFLYWTIVGYATVAALHAGRAPLRNLLIAPTVGVLVNVLPLFTLNRLGVPVKSFGAFVPPVLLCAAGLVLWRLWKKDPERVALPWRKVAGFAGVAALALYLTGRPMLEFGFDWLSFCNDDMANYCLAADRVYRHGFFDFPAPEHLLEGRYFASDYYFLYVGVGVRPGSEWTLAGVAGVTGRSPHEIYMPTMLAFHLALVWGAGALLLRVGGPWTGKRGGSTAPVTGTAEGQSLGVDPGGGAGDDGFLPALIACVVLSASALLNLGVLYQLIAQTIGLAIIAVMAGLIMRPFAVVPRRGVVLHGLLVAVVGSGLLVFYPEIGPFIALPFFLYIALGLARRRLKAGPPLALVGVGALGALVLLQKYAVMTFVFLKVQAASSSEDSFGLDPKDTLFPYFMLPKGLCDLWGVLPVAGWTAEPGLSIAIAAGGLLLLASTVAALWGTWRGRPEAAITLVMLAVGAFLFQQRVGFGLFKLAMYIQPFVLTTLVAGWFAFARRLRVRTDVGLAAAAAVVAAYLMVTHGRGALAQTAMGQPSGRTLLEEFPWAELLLVVLPLLLGSSLAFAVGRKRRRSTSASVGGDGMGAAPRLPWAVVAAAPLLALAYVGLTGQQLYLRASRGKAPQFQEVPLASEARVVDEFREILASSPHPRIVSDTYNMVLAKFQALYTGGRVLSFPSGRFFYQLENKYARTSLFLSEEEATRATELREAMWGALPEVQFDLKDPKDPEARNVFRICDMGLLKEPGSDTSSARTARATLPPDPEKTLFVQAVGRQSVFNRQHFPPEERDDNYHAATLSRVRNQLVFVQSKLGRPYFLPGGPGSPTALYQVEEEPKAAPFFGGGSFASVGRYLLLQAVNPTPKVRVVFTYTCSYNGDGEAKLPPAAVIGEQRVPLRVVGRGSARLFSDEMEPQQILGRQFLMLDLGTPGKRLPVSRTGLMNLFGTDVAIDPRDVTGRTRDVSIISEEEYQNLRPPSRLSGFEDREATHPLRDRQLEYCGWYENDGWVSEDSYCRLTQPEGRQVVAVRGIVPKIEVGFRTDVSLLLDGTEVARAEVAPEQDGRFALSAPADAGSGTREVRVRFSNYQRLAPPDSRPAGAQIHSIGFEPAEKPAARRSRTRPTTVPGPAAEGPQPPSLP